MTIDLEWASKTLEEYGAYIQGKIDFSLWDKKGPDSEAKKSFQIKNAVKPHLLHWHNYGWSDAHFGIDRSSKD